MGEKMVARDGIEPPTRGFSIPCSTDGATEPLACTQNVLAGQNLSSSSQYCNHKILFFQLPCILPRSIAGIRPANQEEACARIPLNSNGKISAAQDSVCRRRGGMFIFSLSSTNMNAPAIASP